MARVLSGVEGGLIDSGRLKQAVRMNLSALETEMGGAAEKRDYVDRCGAKQKATRWAMQRRTYLSLLGMMKNSTCYPPTDDEGPPPKVIDVDLVRDENSQIEILRNVALITKNRINRRHSQ